MKKKNIIGISVALGILVGIVLIITMVFTLNTISFQLTTTFQDASASHLFVGGATRQSVQAKMLEDASFQKGGNLLFMKFDKNIQSIEQNNPYVKVEKIVRSFPNKITVYYSEREPVALVKIQNNDSAYYVIDEELKVLDVVLASDVSTEYPLPILDDYNEAYSVSKPGFTIANPSLKQKVALMAKCAFSGYGIADALYKDIFKYCESISYYTDGDDLRARLVFSTNNGHKVTAVVERLNQYQERKLKFLWSTYFREFKNYYGDQDASVEVVYNIGTGKVLIYDVTNSSINWTED